MIDPAVVDAAPDVYAPAGLDQPFGSRLTARQNLCSPALDRTESGDRVHGKATVYESAVQW